MPDAETSTNSSCKPEFASTGKNTARFSWRVKLVTVGLSLLIGLLLAEIALRMTALRTGGIFRQADYWTGISQRPHAHGVMSRAGNGAMQINQLGLRDYETTQSKPNGVRRIAMLGDSYVEAAQVRLEDAVSEQLEGRLASLGPYEVLNFGVSGYGTAQEYLQLRENALRFQPDIVLLLVTTGNDVRNNHRELNGTGYIPYFVVHPSGGLHLDTTFRADPTYLRMAARDTNPAWNAIRFAWDHSRVAGLVLGLLATENEPPPVSRQSDLGGPVDPFYKGDWRIYDPRPTGPWAEAWQVTEALILKMSRLCQDRQIRFAIVLNSNAPQVSAEGRTLFAEKYPHLDLDYPGRRMADHCRRHGIPMLDLVPILLEHHRSTGDEIHGFGVRAGEGHWNEIGHRIAAEQIHQFLAAQGWVPNEP